VAEASPNRVPDRSFAGAPSTRRLHRSSGSTSRDGLARRVAGLVELVGLPPSNAWRTWISKAETRVATSAASIRTVLRRPRRRRKLRGAPRLRVLLQRPPPPGALPPAPLTKPQRLLHELRARAPCSGAEDRMDALRGGLLRRSCGGVREQWGRPVWRGDDVDAVPTGRHRHALRDIERLGAGSRAAP